jgi:hypothetical protein
MVVSNFLKAAEKFEIQANKRPKNPKELRKTHVALYRIAAKASVPRPPGDFGFRPLQLQHDLL